MTGRCFSLTCLPLRQPRRISNFRSPAAVLLAASSPAGELGGHVVERVGSDVTAIFLHLGRRPAKNADQNIAEFFGSVAPSVFGPAHKQQHEGSDVQKVAKFGQRFAKGLQSVCGR